MNKNKSDAFAFMTFAIGIFIGLGVFLYDKQRDIKPEPNTIEITFPAEDIRCVQQDGKIVFCESYREEWR
jgi:hypothetical protein